MAGQKNFRPSAQKLKKAREDGDVAKSSDLSQCLGTSFGIAFILAGSSWGMFQAIPYFFARCFLQVRQGFGAETELLMTYACALVFAATLMLLLPVVVVVLAAEAAQVGLQFSLSALKIKWERVNPISGLLRVFGMLGVEKGGEGFGGKVLFFLRISVIISLGITLVGKEIISQVSHLIILDEFAGKTFLARLTSGGWGVLGKLAVLGFCVGVVDYVWKVALRRRRLAMDFEELKKEMREHDGDPETKSRRRQLYNYYLLSSVVQGVRRARVVISNKR